jgi:hemoglobin-like flavoprotein
MKQQRIKLMKMLGHAVGALRDPEGLVPALQGLARKHVDYGVQPEHFEPVAVALLATLEKGLGDAWTSEVKASWIQAYTLVSSVMKAALIEEMANGEQPLVSDTESDSDSSSSSSDTGSDPVPEFTAARLKLLRRQVRKVTPIEEDFNEMFYSELFELCPEAEALFPKVFVRRRGKLMKMIGQVLHTPTMPSVDADMIQQLRDLGKLHTEDKSVTLDMFKPAREALFTTLEKTLGEDKWDVVGQEAWTAAFDLLEYFMVGKGSDPGKKGKASKAKKEKASSSKPAEPPTEPDARLLTENEIAHIQRTWAAVIPPAKDENASSSPPKKTENMEPGARRDLILEAEIMMELPWHENIVQTVGLCEDPLLLIMEICDGGSLEALLNTHFDDIPTSLKSSLLWDAALGAAHMARFGIVHNDLAPRNILLVRGHDGHYTAKLSDFGLSQQVAAEDSADGIEKQGTFNAPGIVGPIKHLAPEVFEEPHVCSEKSDMWAWGVTAIQVFGGEEPFPTIELSHFAREAKKLVAQMPQQVPKSGEIPEGFVQLLKRRVFALDPTARAHFEEILSTHFKVE